MTKINFIPKDPIKPIFGIKLSPTLHKVLNTLKTEDEKLKLVAEVLGINPKRIITLKNILDENQNTSTMVVLYDYIFKHIKPKFEVPYNDKGVFEFKIYDIDFNQDINIEKILEKIKN